MDENTLKNLPPNEAESQTPVEKPAESPAVAGQPTAPPKEVDEPPDPTVLKTQIEELEAKRKKAEEDAIYWRKQKAESRAEYFRDRDRPGEPPPPPAPVSVVGPEPRPSDFEDYDRYVIALTDHRVKLARAEWERDANRRQQEQAQAERMTNLTAKLQEGYQKYPDFEEVAFDRTASHITPMVVDILSECDHPADVAYYLAKNRVEGVAISRMTPIKAARAIAQIESKLANAPAPQAPPPARKISSAPPPITPIAGGGSGINKDPEKMTQREYEQWRASQGARRF